MIEKVKNVKMITLGCTDFVIDDEGVLLRMANMGGRRNVTIPHEFPSGDKIKSIAERFCSGSYGKIIISDEITNISDYAFQGADVWEVQWSKECKTIPKDCFGLSALKTITNIEDVETIEENAFYYCISGSFTWSEKCTTIPTRLIIIFHKEKTLFFPCFSL